MLTAGQIHDLACAPDLIENADLEALIAGKAYDADALTDGLAEREIAPVILPKANRKAVRPSGTAISGFSASAISLSASSIRLSTFAPSRPDTTNWRQILSPQFNWSRL